MQTSYKGIFIALLVAFVAQAHAQQCTGDKDISALPYSTKWTTTGDASSTTFIMTVCNTQCTAPDAEECRPLQSLSVGASGDITTSPSSEPLACGPTFTGSNLGSLGTQSPSEPEHCEAFYMTSNKANAKLADVCGGGACKVQMVLDNGVTALGSAGPNPTPTPTPSPTPSPGPTPYGRRRSLQQVPEVTSYGRRRSLQQASPTPYGRRF